MKYLYLNLKRFDVASEHGGVNHNPALLDWAPDIIRQVQPALGQLRQAESVDFVAFLPEAHLIPALKALDGQRGLAIGCQSVHDEDIAPGGNFGAFTSLRPAQSMAQLGIGHTIIGHFEERKYLGQIYGDLGQYYVAPLNQRLNRQIKCAQAAGMKVLYCVGENLDQRDQWQSHIQEQLEIGLSGVDRSQIVIAYEPIWAIGPGKTPASGQEIEEVAAFIKSVVPDVPVIYGGGLKAENAAEIAQLASVDGGLIALTRFSGDIGFYPDEYLKIIDTYLKHKGDQ